MFTIQPESKGKNLYILAEGVLTHEDYQALIPEMESRMEGHDKLNCVIDLSGWEGWEWRAMWDDFVTGMKHFNDFGRLAIIGRDDQKWMEWFGKFYDLFRGDETKFFTLGEGDLARNWCWLDEESEAA